MRCWSGCGDVPSVTPNHSSIVARLVALLPRGRATGPAPGAPKAAAASPPQTMTAVWIGVLLVLLIGQAIAPRPEAPAGIAPGATTVAPAKTGGNP